MRAEFLVALAFGLLASGAAASGPVAPSGPEIQPWGVDLAGGDPKTRPGHDFFRHANGRWLDKTDIPPDRATSGVHATLVDLNETRIRDILEHGAPGADETVQQSAAKLTAFYASFMNEARIEAADMAPVAAGLDRIRKAATHEDVAALQGLANSTFGITLFSVSIESDSKDPDRYAVTLGQSGINLPDREYYLDRQFADKLAAYRAYIAQLLAMAGWPNADTVAEAVVAFETLVAEASWANSDRRDPETTYNPFSVRQLTDAAPFPWAAMLRSAQLDSVQRVVVAEKSAFPKLAAIYAATPVDVLKAWMAFGFLDGAAPYLPRRFAEAQFRFRRQVLDGVFQPPPRWRRAYRTVEGALGEVIGRVYVARYFTEAARDEVTRMMDGVRAAMAKRLADNPWMGAETKRRALEKLKALRVKIGHPTVWRDYSGLRVEADDLAGNVERSVAFEWQRQVDRLAKPVDRDEWSAAPQMVNAFYDPGLNDITLPAGQLQPPFFDPLADPAVNYGAIGAILGHELVHAFDDAGRKFDKDGRLTNWWTAKDARQFEARAKSLSAQYSRIEVYPGARINGELTKGENIADLGGILLALDAYKASLGKRSAPVLGGYGGPQRFFLGYAQTWRDKTTEDFMRRQLVSDNHAPEEARVNLVVRNVDAWYEAFGVKPGDALYLAPKSRVRLW